VVFLTDLLVLLMVHLAQLIVVLPTEACMATYVLRVVALLLLSLVCNLILVPDLLTGDASRDHGADRGVILAIGLLRGLVRHSASIATTGS